MKANTIKGVFSPIISTKRLLLRPFELSDAPSMFKWASDEEVTRYLRFKTHATLSESQSVIKHWLEEANSPYFFHWAIVHTATGDVIGSIGLHILNYTDRRGEIGYCLTKVMWNHGYASEALGAILCFGFEKANFNRLEACHSVTNPASGKVMQKAGMRWEAGPLVAYYKSSQSGFQDVMMYALTKQQWSEINA